MIRKCLGFMPLCRLSCGAGRDLHFAGTLEPSGQESENLVGQGTVLGS